MLVRKGGSNNAGEALYPMWQHINGVTAFPLLPTALRWCCVGGCVAIATHVTRHGTFKKKIKHPLQQNKRLVFKKKCWSLLLG